jgi:hypothetical protein
MLTFPRANEYRRYLQACISATSLKVSLLRLIAAAIQLRLWEEIQLLHRQRAVVILVRKSGTPIEVLHVAINAEIDGRRNLLLGSANNPGALSVLSKVAANPEVHRQLASSLRDGRAEIRGGKVIYRFRNQVIALVSLFLLLAFWFLLVYSGFPQDDRDLEHVLMFAVSGLIFLAYLFWPWMKTIRKDLRAQRFANSAKHIR